MIRHNMSDVPAPAPVVKALSANAKVVLALKESILGGTYPPNTLLPSEEALVKQLGVSRVPLREGIKQLEAIGWLKIERGNGTRVVQPDFSVIEPTLDFLSRFEIVRFQHLHQLRRLIEIENIQDVARAQPTGLVGRLRDANALIERQHAEPAGYVDADVAFHDLLVAVSPNPLFPRLLAGFRKYMLLSRRLSFSGPEAVLDTVRAHEAIIVTIENGDPAAAKSAMEIHLQVTGEQLHL